MPNADLGPALGLIVPSVNRVVEREWAAAWPTDVPYYISRARYVYGPTALEGLYDDSLRAAEDLKPARVTFGVFACTGGSFFRGTEGNEHLTDELSRFMGCPVITASSAVVAALKHVKANKVAVVTPYAEPDITRAAQFLTAEGFEVPHASGMGIADASLESDVEPEAVFDFALEQVKGLEVDAVLVSCTNLRSWSVLPRLEERLGMPVITSNQASLFAAVQALRLNPPSPAEFGSLFASDSGS